MGKSCRRKGRDIMQNPRKVAVIGCGFVGASIAFSLMQKGLFSELVLIDSNTAKAHGEAMDLSHGLPYTASMDIYAGSYYHHCRCKPETGRNKAGPDWQKCRHSARHSSANHLARV